MTAYRRFQIFNIQESRKISLVRTWKKKVIDVMQKKSYEHPPRLLTQDSINDRIVQQYYIRH